MVIHELSQHSPAISIPCVTADLILEPARRESTRLNGRPTHSLIIAATRRPAAAVRICPLCYVSQCALALSCSKVTASRSQMLAVCYVVLIHLS
jgi:hypothetical protein